jgi:hypothetical protein
LSSFVRSKYIHLLVALATISILLIIWLVLIISDVTLEQQLSMFQIMQVIATVSAIIIGGFWSYRAFFRERIAEPMLNLDQKIIPLELPDGRVLLKVFVKLSNVGKVQIELKLWSLEAEKLLPLTEKVENKLSSKSIFTDQVSIWPLITSEDEGKFVRPNFYVLLDPGETDSVIGNIIIPGHIEVIQVYSQFRTSQDRKYLGWPIISLVDLRDLKSEKRTK